MIFLKNIFKKIPRMGDTESLNRCFPLIFLIFLAIQDFHQIGPLGRFDLVVAMSVCLCVCLSVPFHVGFFEAYYAPSSRNRMTKMFRDSESLGKSAERSGLRIEHFCWNVV